MSQRADSSLYLTPHNPFLSACFFFKFFHFLLCTQRYSTFSFFFFSQNPRLYLPSYSIPTALNKIRFHTQRPTPSSHPNPFGCSFTCSSEALYESSSTSSLIRGAPSCSETMCTATSIPDRGIDAALICFVSWTGSRLFCRFP